MDNPNEDMSAQTCIEHIEHFKHHERLTETLILIDERLNHQTEALKLLHKMCNVLKEELTCLKQDS